MSTQRAAADFDRVAIGWRLMALVPLDDAHAAQILAGTDGRNYGHKFEERLANQIAVLGREQLVLRPANDHLVVGTPAVELLSYVATTLELTRLDSVEAWWLGGLATMGRGDDGPLGHSGLRGAKSKSDVLLRLRSGSLDQVVGVGVKTCNNPTPTNAQLYFTTASAFCSLLRARGITVPPHAEAAMKMFCGDNGYRPCDDPHAEARTSPDDTRWFWEELPDVGRSWWEQMLADRQDEVTRALVQYAYPDDPHVPDFILHQRYRATQEERTPLALYSIEEFISYSAAENPFETREYRVSKGSHKDPASVHLAPRFGVVQFQRGGQRQHPTQLQFNLRSGYFNRFPAART